MLNDISKRTYVYITKEDLTFTFEDGKTGFDLLIKKIESGFSFKLKSGMSGQVVLQNNKKNKDLLFSFFKGRVNRIKLTTEDGKEIPLGHLGPVEEIRKAMKSYTSIRYKNDSSSTKSSKPKTNLKPKISGVNKTESQEILQCYYLAALNAEGSNKPCSYFTPEILSKYSNVVHANIDLNKVLQALSEEWNEVSYKIAKKILNSNVIDGGKYEYYHDKHRWIEENVYNNYKKLMTKDSNKIPELNGNIPGSDKWNPSDIWIKKAGERFQTSAKNIYEFNEQIFTYLKNKKLIGISLKKITGTPRLILQNAESDMEKIPTSITFNKIIDKKTKSLFATSNGNLSFELKNKSYWFDFWPGLSFELNEKGTSARHGSVGLKNVLNILQSYSISKTLSNSLEESKAKLIYKNRYEEKNPQVKKYIDQINEFHPYSFEDFKKDIEFLEEKYKTKSELRFVKKYKSIQGLYIFKSITPAIQTKIVKTLYDFCSSTSDWSSSYYKVY